MLGYLLLISINFRRRFIFLLHEGNNLSLPPPRQRLLYPMAFPYAQISESIIIISKIKEASMQKER